jgi:thiol:disulfide interchange protein
MTSSMRPVLTIGTIVLAMAAIVGISDWREAHAKDIIPWRPNLAAAQAEARQSHRPVFLYFTASWCGPCQKMKSTTWADNIVRQAMEKYVPVKVDVDAEPAMVERFGIRAMPTYLIVSEQGEVQRQQSGLMLPEQMAAWLEK